MIRNRIKGTGLIVYVFTGITPALFDILPSLK
jgi:hypothetical protein